MSDHMTDPQEFYLAEPPRPTIAKALTAAAVGLAGVVGESLLDGALSLAEVGVALGVGLLAGVATYRVPYFARPDDVNDDDGAEGEAPETSGRHRG